ncbi:MAG TPA: hypothetical protein VFZ22_14410 [Pyrinomonadaceae bacterium]|nr:hypothetical protein [Pyrinomonadaceae bacterium]
MPDLGVRLQLLIGANVPVPAPFEVMDSFIALEVRHNDRERDVFDMELSLGKDSLLDYGLLLNGYFDPPNRIVIAVLMGVLPEVLIDGVITSHQVMPSNTPGESTLRITGEDISLRLDLDPASATHANQPDSVIVTKILAKYLQYGITPQVTQTPDVPIEVNRVPSQQETDLAYIRRLAERNGFVFYIEPLPAPGFTTAYFGLDNRLGLPQPALSLNMGPQTNVDQPINFHYNALGPVTPQVTILDPITKTPIQIPAPSGLRPPLASRPSTPLRTYIARDSANLEPSQGLLRAVQSSTDSSDAVSASGEVDAVRYGQVLRSRRLVGVRGAGFSYNGNYYVKQVTHRIRRGEYKQTFSLSREGLGSLTPAVVPSLS